MLDLRNVCQLAAAAPCDCCSPKCLPNHQAPGGPPRTQAPSISQHLPAAMFPGGSCGTRIPVHTVTGQHSRPWPPAVSHKPWRPAHSAAECFHGSRPQTQAVRTPWTPILASSCRPSHLLWTQAFGKPSRTQAPGGRLWTQAPGQSNYCRKPKESSNSYTYTRRKKGLEVRNCNKRQITSLYNDKGVHSSGGYNNSQCISPQHQST